MPSEMSRAEHYCAGYAQGELWAEKDVHDHPSLVWEVRELTRHEATLAHSIRVLSSAHDNHAAYLLGHARGYRVNSKL